MEGATAARSRWITAALITVAVVGMLPQTTVASGAFELRLISFTNDQGLDDLGRCCSDLSSNSTCSSPCNTYFRVCLQHYQATVDPNRACTFGEVSTTPSYGNNIQFQNGTHRGFTNPIRFEFDFLWTGTFSLVVEAWHQNPTLNGVNKTLISRLATSRWLDVGSEWSEDNSRSNWMSLRYAYRVLCQENYYDKGCSKLCRPRDDKFGHFNCSSEGDKVCLSGWSGEYCLNPICTVGCHEIHGHCDLPNECKCRMGWQGRSCDQCIRYPGCLHGTCSQPWECTCNEGWGGLFCNQDLNYCTNHKPCKNGGTCTNTGQGSYTCTCPEGFSGSNCDVHVDNCNDARRQQPYCLNGGTCLSSGANVSCSCRLGYVGSRCESRAPNAACLSAPCNNGGVCHPNPRAESEFTCRCPPEYDGMVCERQKDICRPNPCQNDGVCVAFSNGSSFECRCPTGYTGSRCETNIDDCAHQPCRNGGTCVDEINSFRCHCVPGFTGPNCQRNVDDCLLKPCANGGICHDLINDYRCTCQPGFTGKDCSANVDECRSSPCLNGGTCRDEVNEYVCLCIEGFGGQRCEVDLSTLVNLAPPFDDSSSRRTTESWLRRDVEATESSVVELSRQIADRDDDGRLSPEQLALVASLSAVVPLIVLIAVVVILIMRHRKRLERERHEEEVQKQNRVNSMNNAKCFDKVQIVNPLDKNATLSQHHRTLKVTNEGEKGSSSFAKEGTLQRTNKQTNLECANKRAGAQSLAQVHGKDTAPSEDVQRTLERRDSVHTVNSLHGVYSDLITRSETPREACPHGIYVIEDHYTSPYEEDMLATEV